MGYNNKTMSSYQTDTMTDAKLREFIAGGRNKVTRTIANNTTARLIDGDSRVAIRLRSTDIITFNAGDTITLQSGGWLSVTTKERINRYTKAGISQRAGIWYMRDGSLFYDGMAIHMDGTPIKPKQPEKHEKALKAIKLVAKQYAHDYVVELKAGNIPMPSSGDCWACLGIVRAGDAQHIRDHISEKYYVPTLLVNAGRAAGYRDDQIGLMGIGGRRLFIDPERNIYKFVVKQLQGAL
jgi:hypothetical protein